MKKDPLMIIHQGALGDFVLILPLLLRLKDEYRIDIFCSHQNALIATHLKIVNKAFPVEAYAFSSLFSRSPDPIIVQLLNSYKKILLFSFSEELKVALESVTRAEVFLVAPRPEPNLRIHVMEYIKCQLSSLGLMKKDNIDIAIKRCFHNPEGITIIHPGAGSKRKRWALLNFISLFRMLEKEAIKTEFLIGPAEEDLCPSLIQFVSRDKLNFIHDILLLLRLLSSARAIIGNDSGILHLAAFLGIPSLAIFGPSDPLRWRPIGKKVVIVRPKLECTPCFETQEKNCAHPLCLHTKPEIVFQQYLKLIS